MEVDRTRRIPVCAWFDSGASATFLRLDIRCPGHLCCIDDRVCRVTELNELVSYVVSLPLHLGSTFASLCGDSPIFLRELAE